MQNHDIKQCLETDQHVKEKNLYSIHHAKAFVIFAEQKKTDNSIIYLEKNLFNVNLTPPNTSTTSDLCKTENSKRKNIFDGVNTKKQRSFFGEGFAQSVHKPLDVYNGKLYLSVPVFTFSFLNTLLIINNYSARNSRKKG